MPTYDYFCCKCKKTQEEQHSIKEDPVIKCIKCKNIIHRTVSAPMYIIGSGITTTLADHKENEHHKKVKDFERAVKKRKKLFGHSEVGDPSDKPDPRHIIKKGRTLGGQFVDVNKDDFIKAAAKDEYIVQKAKETLKDKKT